MFEIEKSIPIPEDWSRGRKQKYPFDNMEIGDSFFVPRDEEKATNLILSISSAKRRALPKQFTVRYIRTEKGVRTWRVG